MNRWTQLTLTRRGSAMAEMLTRVEDIARRNEVRIATIAHAGDGNLHPLFLTPPGDEVARVAAQTAFEELIDAALDLGGTVTGEHGVGLLKRTGMCKELGPEVLETQKAIKGTLDPLGLFNPGKVIG
ncbi:FAD-binding oxidoreductase [Brevibacterium sp. 239c]|uniref:FAD-binding oxidoreductase n=1 Tax=Brevibacterium sp. 239c TaxID=1965356 RepID=UPI001C60EAC2|nr:FAD-linked oxidase C-terminal domain-containing protein [Brevibacterium sp. 239c]